MPGAFVERGARQDPGARLARAEVARQVHEVLAELRDLHREVLVLVPIEGRSVAEAAEILGVPEGTVKSRLSHARARFREVAERLGHQFELGEEVDDA